MKSRGSKLVKKSRELYILKQRSDERLAHLVGKHIIPEIGEITSLLDIGCGDGALRSELEKTIIYKGLDIVDSLIYEKAKDSAISYIASEDVSLFIREKGHAFESACLLDVLEHTIEFEYFAEQCGAAKIKLVVISLPNELFLYDRIRFLFGTEVPAHSLNLRKLPAGFKHQYLINIDKAREILTETLSLHGYSLKFEVFRELIPKNVLLRIPMHLISSFTDSSIWSMGSIFVFALQP